MGTGHPFGAQRSGAETEWGTEKDQEQGGKINRGALWLTVTDRAKSGRHRKSQCGTTSGRRTHEQKIHRGFNKKKPPDLAAEKSKGRKYKI
jgi:hypothetical protein